jgi:aromatic ring-opening dioxygenase catalytic subunit (LigB family)
MFPMYPEAQVPIVQLSLKRGYDPKLHLEVGAAQDEAATCFYHEEAFAGGITVSSFRFGNAVAEDCERSNSRRVAEGRTL